jgi:hypothetical protein
MMGEPPERRRAERVSVNSEFGALPGLVHVSDLSEHGVFVHTDQRPSLGAIVTVRFTVLLDDPVVIAARGKVVRHSAEPGGVGIEFTRVSPDMVLRIGDVVTHQRPRLLDAPVAPAGRRTSAPPAATGSTRVTRPPQPPGDTKVVTAPTASAAPSEPAPTPAADEFDASQTLVKLQAVDVEILDDDDEFDEDPGTSAPRGRRR